MSNFSRNNSDTNFGYLKYKYYESDQYEGKNSINKLFNTEYFALVQKIPF